MIGFFIPIAEALVAGYLVAAAVYMALLFLITRLSQRILMRNHKLRPTYNALHAAALCLAAYAGTYLCSTLSPLPPYGMLGFPVFLAILLALVLLRAFRQLSGQMSASALALNILALCGGAYLGLTANHVFIILAHLP